MKTDSDALSRYVEAIRRSDLTIYDPIEIGDPDLWIPTPELEELLNAAITGISLAGLPLRTRSKIVKEHVCRALGYPAPLSFTKTQPRFPGQVFDTYVQKSNNLQIWNEELAPTRRYAIFRIGKDDVIIGVRVVTGNTLSQLDTTGTLTQKYQARAIPSEAESELIAVENTDLLRPLVQTEVALDPVASPTSHLRKRQLFSIREVFEKL